MKKNLNAILLSVVIVLLSICIGLQLSARHVHAQSGNVIYLQAVAGTSLAANCAVAPSTPAHCLVADGDWTWQSATATPATATSAAIPGGWYKATNSLGGGTGTVKTVNGVAPGTTGNVSVNCADTMPATTAPVTFTGTSPSVGATVPVFTPATKCSGAGS